MQPEDRIQLGPSTVIGVEGSSIWEIRRFSELEAEVGKYISSEPFIIANRSWALELCPNGWKEAQRGFVCAFVKNMQTDTVRFGYSFAAVDKNGEHLSESAFDYDELTKLQSVGNVKLLDRKCVFDKSSKLLDNDTLRIKVTIALQGFCTHRPRLVTPEVKICKEIGLLFENGKHSDVKIMVDGTEIVAHRSILSARSPVFDAMFSHKMSETLEGVVCVDDISFSVFRQLLRFVYQGQCDFDSSRPLLGDSKSGEIKGPDTTCQLLMAADRFQIPDLVSICADRLARTLNVTNAAERYAVAESCNLAALKNAALCVLREEITKKTSLNALQKFDLTQLHQLLLCLGITETS